MPISVKLPPGFCAGICAAGAAEREQALEAAAVDADAENIAVAAADCLRSSHPIQGRAAQRQMPIGIHTGICPAVPVKESRFWNPLPLAHAENIAGRCRPR